MNRPRQIAALAAVASSLVASPARGDVERHCEERPLDAAERAAAARVLSAFRSALPDAPVGWTVRKDIERVSGFACEAVEKAWAPGGKLVPQPIDVHVHREYLRSGAPPRTEAQAADAPVPAKPMTVSGAEPDRREELEARLAELQRNRNDAVREYQEARFKRGDPAAGAKIDSSAPRTRVQTIAVEISGNPATTEALRGNVDVAALRRLAGMSPSGVRQSQAPVGG